MSSLLDGLFAPDDTQLPASFGNEALIRRQLQLRDREADLKEKAKAARDAAPPQGQMVSGIYVKPSIAQQLTPLAQQISQAIQKKGLEADQTGYDSIEAAAVQRHMAQRPPDDAPLQAKVAWARNGQQIPAMRSLMADYEKDLMVNEPDRVINRADKKDALTAALAAKKEALQAQIEDRQQARSDQLDRQREHDETLRAMKSMGGGGGSGGDKASNYQVFQDNQGNLTRVNKLTGESSPLGSGGREAASVTKAGQDAAKQQGASQDALATIAEARKLLPRATGSGLGAGVDSLYRLTGSTNEGMKANRALKQLSGQLTMTVPRFEGPQSDKDVAAYKEQSADVGNESLTREERLAALKQVEAMHRRTIANADRTKAAAAGRTLPKDDLRGDVERALKQSGSVDDLVNKYSK
jgi:hypothetical protein